MPTHRQRLKPDDLVVIKDELGDEVMGLFDDVKVVRIPNGTLAIVVRVLQTDNDRYRPSDAEDVLVLCKGMLIKVWDEECELVPQ